VRNRCDVLGSHKGSWRGMGSVPKQGEESSQLKKRNFYWRGEKEGVTLLESAPFGQKSTQTQVWVRWSDKDH
jgi:hypothetical protein